MASNEVATVAQRMQGMGAARGTGITRSSIRNNLFDSSQGPRTQNNTFTGIGYKNGQQVQYHNGQALPANGASGKYTGYDQKGTYYENGTESSKKPEPFLPAGIQTPYSVNQNSPGVAGKNGPGTLSGPALMNYYSSNPQNAPVQKPFDPSTQYTSNPSSYSAGFKAPNDGVYRGNQGWKFTDLDHPPPKKPDNTPYNYTREELIENGKYGQAYASKAGQEWMEKSKAQEAAYKANGGKYSMGMDGKMIMDLSNTSQPIIPKEIPLTKNGYEEGGRFRDGSLMGGAANTKPYSPGIPGYTIGYTPGGNVTSNWNGKEWVKTYY